jgi:hypothetical protein
VTFTPPRLGNRTVDFNTEGMLHIGLLPELIEDARRDGVSDAELEPLFRSAEGVHPHVGAGRGARGRTRRLRRREHARATRAILRCRSCEGPTRMYAVGAPGILPASRRTP